MVDQHHMAGRERASIDGPEDTVGPIQRSSPDQIGSTGSTATGSGQLHDGRLDIRVNTSPVSPHRVLMCMGRPPPAKSRLKFADNRQFAPSHYNDHAMAWRGDEAVVITADVKEQLSRGVINPSGGGLPQSGASDVSQLIGTCPWPSVGTGDRGFRSHRLCMSPRSSRRSGSEIVAWPGQARASTQRSPDAALLGHVEPLGRSSRALPSSSGGTTAGTGPSGNPAGHSSMKSGVR